MVAKLPTSTKRSIPSNIRTWEFWKGSAELLKLYVAYISYIYVIYRTFECVFSPAIIPFVPFKTHPFYGHTHITHQKDYLQITSSFSILIHEDPQKNRLQKCLTTARLAIRIHFIQTITKIPLIPTLKPLNQKYGKIYNLNLIENCQLVILLIAFLLLRHFVQALESDHSKKYHTSNQGCYNILAQTQPKNGQVI